MRNWLGKFVAELRTQVPELRSLLAAVVACVLMIGGVLAAAVLGEIAKLPFKPPANDVSSVVSAPTKTTEPTAKVAGIKVDLLRLSPSSKFYEEPVDPLTGRGLYGPQGLFYNNRIWEVLNSDECFEPNELSWSVQLAQRILSKSETHREAIVVASQLLAFLQTGNAPSGPLSSKVRSHFNAMKNEGLVLDPVGGKADQQWALEIVESATRLLREKPTEYFQNSEEDKSLDGLPKDAGAVFDLVLKNEGTTAQIIYSAALETRAIGMGDAGAGDGGSGSAYPLETVANLTFFTGDNRPVVFKNPIVVPPGDFARFAIDVQPEAVSAAGKGPDGLYVQAWIATFHFNGGNGRLASSFPICVILPKEVEDGFW